MYLFYDTETNGLPLNGIQPRITQLAFILMDENFNSITEYCQLIYPDGWTIPNEKFFIDNGFTTENNIKCGIPIKDALNAFIDALEKCKYMIAHNDGFDIPVIASEMKYLNLSSKNKPVKLCTMKSTANFVGALNKYNKIKWPKLSELHIKLFNEDFDGAHDALEDVKATARCFRYLNENKLIDEWKNI